MKILLITGQSGVGKTAISKACSKRLGAMYLRSRDIARHLAHVQGYTRARDWILAVGAKQAIREIDDYVLTSIDNARTAEIIVVDGAYDGRLLAELGQRFASEDIHIVEVTASRDVRIQRTAMETGGDETASTREMDFLDDLKRQVGVSEVVTKAELVVESSDDISSALDVICSLVVPANS
ncbi:MAG TPA: AAA family ATPase [Verrucomicrobiae bacterium]|jgi:dephospho-CoA kinase|nr:AAA family ATPase [Verrucomicrobiae bacterium]